MYVFLPFAGGRICDALLKAAQAFSSAVCFSPRPKASLLGCAVVFYRRRWKGTQSFEQEFPRRRITVGFCST